MLEKFTPIPNHILDGTSGLSAYQIVVYSNLFMHKLQNNQPSQKQISRECGISLSTLKRTLKSLKELKLI